MKNDNTHSEDFIRQKIGNTSGFSVPKNYLENLEDDLLLKLSEDTLPNENGFNVPTNYLSTIEENIITEITSEENITKVISISERIKRFIPYASAACVALLLFTGIYFFNNQNTSFKDISVADIEAWYEDGYGRTSNTELAMILETSDFNENELNPSSISSEDIDNYINLIDNSGLILETEN